MLVLKNIKAKIIFFFKSGRNFLPSGKILCGTRSRKILTLLALAVLLGINFKMATSASAGLLEDYIYPALASILEAIASLIVRILLWVIHFIIELSGYNNFLNAHVVSIGWSLTRDVANMFYILVMLIIAFGTMLKVEQYSWRKLLPRLIFTAILVNFSKTIIGLFIDFSQVVMLTFVNGYAAVAGGNFVTMFALDKMFKVATEGLPTGIPFEVVVAYMLGVILLGVALIVTAVFAGILLFRIITLWILIVLSPLAFALGTFPRGQQYYADWWKRLTNQIIVGPVIAFFLWLSLAAMGGGDQMSQIEKNNVISEEIRQAKTEETTGQRPGGGELTEISKWENLGSFAVSIAMLFVALQMTQELGVVGAGLASGAAGWMKNKATAAAKGMALGVPKWGLKKGWETTEGARKPMWLALSRVPGLKMVGARRAGAIEAKRMERAEKKIKGVQFLPLTEQMRLAETWKPTLPTNKIAKAALIEKMMNNPGLARQVRTEWGAAAPERMSGVLNNYEKLAGNDERKLNQIHEFKEKNPDLVYPENDRRNIVKNLKVDDVVRISATAFLDPIVTEEIGKDGKKEDRLMNKGSKEQRENYLATRRGYQTAERIFTKEELRDPQGEQAGHENHPASIQQKTDANLVKLISLPTNIFSALRADQKFKALSLEKIKVGEIDAGELTMNNGELAGLIATKGDDQLTSSAIEKKSVAFREGLGSQIQQTEIEINNLRGIPAPTTADEQNVNDLEEKSVKLRETAIRSSGNSAEGFESSGYNQGTDRFTSPSGQEAISKILHSAEPPSWLRELKVEAVFQKDPHTGLIRSLKNFGSVLGQNINVNNLLKLAQQATTLEQKKLISALMLAKKEKTEGKNMPELSKSYKAPVFGPFLEEMRNFEDELRP